MGNKQNELDSLTQGWKFDLPGIIEIWLDETYDQNMALEMWKELLK